jgi:hypothetical protein
MNHSQCITPAINVLRFIMANNRKSTDKSHVESSNHVRRLGRRKAQVARRLWGWGWGGGSNQCFGDCTTSVHSSVRNTITNSLRVTDPAEQRLRTGVGQTEYRVVPLRQSVDRRQRVATWRRRRLVVDVQTHVDVVVRGRQPPQPVFELVGLLLLLRCWQWTGAPARTSAAAACLPDDVVGERNMVDPRRILPRERRLRRRVGPVGKLLLLIVVVDDVIARFALQNVSKNRGMRKKEKSCV